MPATIHVLILEDSADDALLTQDALRGTGLETDVRVVADAERLTSAMREKVWDVIIADHALPGFSAPAALGIVRAIDPDMPFIIVSGTIDETAAIESMRRGAQDYLFKGNLARLASVVTRELAEAKIRRSNRISQDSIRYLLDHDVATGLPSRVWFLERLTEMMTPSSGSVAVVCLVIDDFRELAYTFGARVLDSWLTTLSNDVRLSAGLQVARVGEDRLAALVLEDSMSGADASKRILRALDGDVTSSISYGGQLRFHVHAGLASSDGDGLNAAEGLLRAAELAATYASQGRLSATTYSTTLDDEKTRRVRLVADLQHALGRGELAIHYQPQVDLADESLVGLEALLRWTHPEWGAISPAEFIPLAEKAGFIGQITDWVFANVARQVSLWDDQAFSGRVSVNISGEDLRDPSFPGRVAQIVAEEHANPARLALEITEGAVLSAGPAAKAALDEIKKLGLRISVDDFGTGYSSLAYLHTLPLDEMKVDRSFVCASLEDERARLVLKSCLDLGRELGLTTVAEGVEDEETLALVRALGCTWVQGYFYSKPLAPADLLAWVTQRDEARFAA